MTDEQEAHLQAVVTQTAKLIESKYRAGQAEHGGNLFDMTARQLVVEALLEAVDQTVYLCTLLNKIPEDELKEGDNLS